MARFIVETDKVTIETEPDKKDIIVFRLRNMEVDELLYIKDAVEKELEYRRMKSNGSDNKTRESKSS